MTLVLSRTFWTIGFLIVASIMANPVFGASNPPVAFTHAATEIVTTSARLNGEWRSDGSETVVYFQFGLTTNLISSTLRTNLGSSDSLAPYALTVAGLRAGTNYFFRMVTSNSVGVSVGRTKSFQTSMRAASILQEAYLKASNAEGGDLTGDRFGFSVAIWGDTAVVGASGDYLSSYTGGEDSSATGVNGDQNNNDAFDSGAAYVFVRDGTNWTQQAYLKASNTEARDSFGFSVAIYSNTIVVGARLEDSGAQSVNGNQQDNSQPGSGAAYVFVRQGTNWVQQAYLKAFNASSNDNFGCALSISGTTILVGASEESGKSRGVNGDPFDDGEGPYGAAYVFVRTGTNWTQQAYLKASNSSYLGYFGGSVSLDNDMAVVGAFAESSASTGVNGNQADTNASFAGAAYVFVRNGTNWTQEAYLKASNAEARDGFGVSVGISGQTIVVGANGEGSSAIGVDGNQQDNSLPLSGAAYVFVRSGSNWTQQAYLKGSRPDQIDQFGFPVAISGDIVVVGSFSDFNNTGAVDLFHRKLSGQWTHTTFIKPDYFTHFFTDWNDEFGRSVALHQDLALIGAHLESSNARGVNGDPRNDTAMFSGAAYVISGIRDSYKPRLSIADKGLLLRISWLSVSESFLLEEAGSLIDSNGMWNAVSSSPITNGNEISVTLPKLNTQQFFRLKRPSEARSGSVSRSVLK